MRAHSFTAEQQGVRYAFGVDRQMTARSLRDLADDIETGRVSVQSARVQSLATAEDWTSTVLRLKLFESRTPMIDLRAVAPALKGPRRPNPPHCDDLVLHAPGECKFCDAEPEAQAERMRARVNFTGHRDKDKLACPSEERRALSIIERWPGNRAKP